MATTELENARSRFLDRLRDDAMAALAHEGFTQYWRHVEQEAALTEDISLLQSWLADIGRDIEKIDALRFQPQSPLASTQVTDMVLELTRQILSLLGEVESTIKKRRDRVRNRVGNWVFLAGPGVKRKDPPPDDKDETKRSRKKPPLVERPNKPKKPTKTQER